MTSSFEHVSRHAIAVLARIAARKAIEAELKDRGVRTYLIRPAELADRARVYLDQHPELFKVAEERARLLGLFEKQPKRPRPRISLPVCD
jgi:hypothetical protein